MLKFLNTVIWKEKPRKTDAEYIEAMREPAGRRRMLAETIWLGLHCLIIIGVILFFGHGVWWLVEVLNDVAMEDFKPSVRELIQLYIYACALIGVVGGFVTGMLFLGFLVRHSSQKKWRPARMLFKYYDLAKQHGLVDEEGENNELYKQ